MARGPWLALLAASFLTSAPPQAWPQGLPELLARGLEGRPELGAATWVGAGEERFLVLTREPPGAAARGLVVILHDLGAHADWPEVVRPLRLGLAAHGWRTAAPQLPWSGEAPGPGPEEEADRRIGAVLAGLRPAPDQPAILVGHGVAGEAALRTAQARPQEVAAVVLVGSAAPLDQGLDLPVVDILGDREAPDVKGAADRRRERAGATPLRQIRVPGAGHGFVGLETALVTAVRGALERLDRDGLLAPARGPPKTPAPGNPGEATL